MTLTQENIDNLTKLAAYLEGLPADYEHFDMHYYFDSDKYNAAHYMKDSTIINECGSVACALGHGFAAGVEPEKAARYMYGVHWYKYSEQFVGYDMTLQVFLFVADWQYIDNTHHGAAARIRYVLDGGELPSGAPLKDMIELYQSYRVDKENNHE